MSYAQGEADLLTLIRSFSGYDATNTARVDWRLLNQGKAQYYIILRPGEWNNTQLTITNYRRDWRTVIEVWYRYSSDTIAQSVETTVSSLVSELEKYPTMNQGDPYLDVTITGGSGIEVIELKDASSWLRQEINVDWSEQVEITYAE